MRWITALRARLSLLFDRDGAEARMRYETRFHIDMERDRLMKGEGLDAAEATRRAMVSFGGVDRVHEEMRAGRGLAWLSGLRLDLKLGARMLLKYPVLTIASVLALTVAVALATSWFEFMSDITNPKLPLPDADRIVSIRNHDIERGSGEPRSLHDFEVWREEARSIEDLGAGAAIEYSLTTADGRTGTLPGMRVTPSMFRFARVKPLLGRTLTDADARPEAEPAAVLSHSVWQRLYDGDRTVVGRTVRLGTTYVTIVGVMPEGFAFPVNQEIWTPLRDRAVDYARREGPQLSIFGRLAPGVGMKEAQAELSLIGERIAAQYPETNAKLRPEVRRFGPEAGMSARVMLFNLPFLLFLVVVSANVATLLFARTATRENEIAMRSALGASRRRIVLQLIAEAFVLTSVASVLGLVAAGFGLRRGMDLFWEVQQERPPFWWDSGLSATTVLYVGVLALLGASIIGGIPALRATGRQLRNRLVQPGGGGAGMRFGAIATVVIVVQVALCVALIPVAILNGQALLKERQHTEFPASRFLSGRLLVGERDGRVTPAGSVDAAAAQARAAGLLDDAFRRVAAEPGVVSATRLSRLPGFNHPIEAVGIEGDAATVLRVRQVAVDPNFFDFVGATITSGRGFRESDVTSTGRVAVADEAWAREVFAGRSPIGQRVQYPSREGERGERWYEIVGVVAGMSQANGPGGDVGLYHPLRPEEHASMIFYLRTDGAPSALVPPIQAMAGSLSGDVGVTDLMPLDDVWRPVERANGFFVGALSVVAAVILLFALIGIYALMSFTVARRAREIGIRAALGATPGRVIMAIFRRALAQIGLGIVAGGTLVSLTIARDPEGLRLVAGVAAAMAVVGLIGCAIPAMRALRIQPTDALRAE